MTLLSPQSISPKGPWRRHFVAGSVVYSGIYFRGVSEVFQSVRIATERPWNKRYTEGGMQREENTELERDKWSLCGPDQPMLDCFLLPPTINISVHWFGPSVGCLALCGRMSPLCTQAEQLPTKTHCSVWKLELTTKSKHFQGLKLCTGYSVDSERSSVCFPRESLKLTYQLCWQSPISMTQCRQYSFKVITRSTAKSYWNAFQSLC
jgi:hypothetical protein